MGREAGGVAGQGDVDEVLFVPQVSKGREYARLKVVPSQAVLLLRTTADRHYGVPPPGTLRRCQRCYRDGLCGWLSSSMLVHESEIISMDGVNNLVLAREEILCYRWYEFLQK